MNEQYDKAIEAYFETLDEIDKIQGIHFKVQHRMKLKKKLRELSKKCIEIETELSKKSEIYLKRIETVKIK